MLILPSLRISFASMQNQVFELKPSRYFTLILSFMVLVSCGICLALPLPAWLRLAAILSLLFYGGRIVQHYALLTSASTIKSFWRKDDKLWSIQVGQDIMEAVLEGDSSLWPGLCILRFRPLHKKRPLSCIIFRDALTRDTYRQLQVCFRA